MRCLAVSRCSCLLEQPALALGERERVVAENRHRARHLAHLIVAVSAWNHDLRVLVGQGVHEPGQIEQGGQDGPPNTRRVTVRSAIQDPKHELRPGMFANFTIQTGNPITAPAAPLSAVVREGDGTMSVWVTSDRHHFHRRTVHLGLQRDDYDQILDAVQAGEEIAVDGAIFLSNMAAGGAS